ncbi:hypothetical protein HAX54_035622 [Datura stramonium]|uniref:Uncharacterized protein n=1 Tax=Datura stramonium TaxID=4076 RepID=A0ABS8VIB8_DATST|nr:hypothetical protein [Datura stramonium]
MISSKRRDTRKAPMAASPSQEAEAEEDKRITQLYIRLDKMEAYYVSIKEKRARQDLLAFTKKLEDKDNKFSWAASIIAEGQPQWAMWKGEIHLHEIKF